jgi:hypothetical protein
VSAIEGVDPHREELKMEMRRLFFKADGLAALILIRILVGWVFLSEGIGKFLYPAEQGAGRFQKIPGISACTLWGHSSGASRSPSARS